ncbi:hypothetical protein HGRIS_014492 [Hohenbuehelia grisea]|uniref:Glycoside hydrolase family 5 domain-containing protein n=1 Tax=Hohenbuehelia grisea TaxID=104357 RepID=A0ABR3JVD4_9AGAR
MSLFFVFLFSLFLTLQTCEAGLPEKIYGVNLGSWLIIEPWMMPQKWIDMGGQLCNKCSKCIASEFDFAAAYPESVDSKLAQHWETWFNQDDVNTIVEYGLNTVRIPLGFWIIEALVDRETEYYPRGGLKHLRRGLKQLQEANLSVILDHHGLPGAQSPNQMFTGRCTEDVQFYNDHNYHRALVWTAVMTGLAHLDPVFGNVASIQAVNEPIQDARKTPGYGRFSKNFVKTIRAVESLLGIHVKRDEQALTSSHNFIAVMERAVRKYYFPREVRNAVRDAAPILQAIAEELEIEPFFFNYRSGQHREPLTTNFMDISWQWNDPFNPATAAIGPQTYDNHLYYSFGGVAAPNEEAHLTHICNLNRVEDDERRGNSPLFFGEWWIAPQFDASDEFLRKFADAQKYAFNKSKGWIFWNFKLEMSHRTRNYAKTRSYFEGVRRGYLTKDAAALHDPHVCDPYRRD